MNSLYFIKNRYLRWFFRFRKRCGYGIHSPFAFQLVTGVIYETDAYYAYSELTRMSAHSISRLRLKDNRLLFRLVNNSQPDTCMVVADDLGLTRNYLMKGREHGTWNFFSTSQCSELHNFLKSCVALDFVYLDSSVQFASLLSDILPLVNDRTLIIIAGIYASPDTRNHWQKLLLDQRVRVSFDLYDFGLLYFESRLNKEDYYINYF